MLQQAFVDNVLSTHGEVGRTWLNELPGLLSTVERRWHLRIAAPFDALSYNYVAPATGADGADRVVKLSVPNPEFDSECAALRLYAGRGIARLIDADEPAGILLLERVRPGAMLTALAAQDDDAATRVAATVLRALWRTAPGRSAPMHHGLRELASWTAELDDLEREQRAGRSVYPQALVDYVVATRRELLASAPDRSVLHGDLHHFNILTATREPWLAIDPKGLVGERAYDIAPFLYNPFGSMLERPDAHEIALRRIAIFCEMLGLDRARVHAWGAVQAVLSEWWSSKAAGAQSPMIMFALALAGGD